ncbi:MAG: LysM peptidoglycan-binding domain-containing protein [[Clostridium] symbiosum]
MFGKTKVRHRSTPGAGIFRPYHRPGARAAAVLLSFCVAFTMMPTPVFAVTQDRGAETGLCEHHPEHDGECGYQEAEPGHPCEHKHTADCYADELICGYIEDEDVTASDSNAGHVHTQECYALDCPHERGEHTEDCGYTEGEAGTPCGYVCGQCGDNPDKDGGNGNTIGGNHPPVQEETRPELAPNGIKDRTVTAFDELDEAVRSQTVKAGTPLEELTLPKTLSATARTGDEEPEPVVIDGVVWEPDALYEGETGEFIFTASAAGYTLSQGVEWPVITVTVEEDKPTQEEIDALCAAIDALPTVEELYENAPGDADPEFDGWVTETKAKLAEVPALWEQFLPLSEDAASMERVTEARAEKLAALNNLMERLGEMEPMADTITPTMNGTNIFANGAEIKIVAGTTEGNTNILYDKNGDNTIGDTEYLKIGTAEPSDAGYNLISYQIYGGGIDINVDGVTKITMTGGKISHLYGGGWAKNSDADVKGTEIILSGGYVHNNVFGGGRASSEKTASVSGDTSVTLSEGVEVRVWVHGGGEAGGSNGSVTVTGNAAVTMTGGTVGQSDTSGQGVHGGGLANQGGISTVGSASVEMTGGTAVAVYGGGWASGSSSQTNVTGAATVSLSGDAEVSGGVYGGGYAVNGGTSTADSKTVTVGGGVKIGGSTAKGIVIDGGTASLANGVDNFAIDSDLTDNASVNVQIPAGYEVASTPAIATGAVEADLAKVKLVGDGAEGNEAYFENNEIKVKAKAAIGPAPTVDVDRQIIFANGAEIKIVAGTTDGQPNTNTNILYDKDGNGTIGDTEYLKIGDTDPTDAGYGLGWYMIYGGGNNTSVTGDTKITMTGGDVGNIIGGSYGDNTTVTGSTSVTVTGGILSGIWAGNAGNNTTVTGNTSVTVTGGIVAGALFGGGDGNNATVTGSKTVTVGGGAKIGATAKNGIFINGGTGTPRVNGVDSFVIDPDLTGGDDSIYVTLPAGYDISSNPTIAISAVEADLAKIKLVGAGADGKEAYFEGNAIKVRAKIACGGVIKSDTPIETISDYFGGAARVENKVITLTGEVKLTGAVTFESGNWILDLNNYNLDTSKANQIKAVAVAGGELTIRGTGGIIGSDLGQTMSADNFGQAVFISSGKLTVEGSVSLTGGKGSNIGADAVRAQNAAVVIKENASLSGGAGPVLGNGFGLLAENCTVMISGSATITGSADQHGIFLEKGSITLSDTPTIQGGTGNYDSSIGLYITDGGTAVISGGTFTGDDNGLFVQGSTSTVTLSGGAYQGGNKAIAIESNTALTVASFLGLGSGYFINGQLVESSQIENKKFLGAANEKVTVKPATVPTITTSTLPGGAVGAAYSQTLTATGITPITWSVSNGSLPDGLNLDTSTGVISGTPTTAGTSAFTVKVENSKGNDTKGFSIPIAAPAPTVTGVTVTPAAPGVQKGTTQQFHVTVTGTNNPARTVTWSIDGSHAGGTTISADGLLTVASDETADTLTVKAVSTMDTSKSGTATVTITEVPPAQTYIISGTVRGSDTGTGIAAVLQLKNSENINTGAPVTAGADGSYTITGIPAGTYHIEVSLAGYDGGTINGIVVSDGDVTGKDLTLQKTVTFIPVAEITMTNAATVEVNTDLALAGTVLPDSATNWAIVWSVADAGGTGAIISGSTFRAATAGTATVKAAIAGGLTATTPYEKTFTIRVTTAPAPVVTHTITASANDGGTISPSGAVTVNDGEGRTFTITPDSGHRISKVTVDGADKGTVTTYTFEHVTADHSISVIFDRINGGGSSSGGGGSSSGGSSSSSGSSSTAPSTTTTTTAGENGTSTTMTQTTSKDSSGKTTTVTTQVTKDAAGNTTGSATTVTTDNITTSADQGSAVVMVKPDGAAINSAAQAAGATAASSMDISVAVPQDTVRSELQKADVSAVRMEVIIPKSVENNPAVRTAGVTVEKETVDAAKQTGKTVTVTVRDDTMAVKAVWSLDGQSMRNAAGQSTDLNLGIHTAPVQSGDPIAEPVKPTVKAAGQENGLVISLTADGTLLSAAKLTVPATNQTAITAGSTVALYRFDHTTGTLRSVSGGIYPVDANGNVTIDIPAGTRMGAKETYVLLPVQGTVGVGTVGTGNGTTHTVRKGDTLNQISKQYGCKVEDLLALNPGVDIYNLQVGSNLKVR